MSIHEQALDTPKEKPQDSHMKQWLNKIEAVNASGKSLSTVRRFIKNFENDQAKVRFITDKKGRGSYEINLDSLFNYFDIPKPAQEDTQGEQSTDSQVNETTPTPENFLEKQQNDIISELIQQRIPKPHITPLYRHSTLWASIVAIIALVCVAGASYLYVQKITVDHSKELSDKLAGNTKFYQEKLTSQKKFFDLKQETSQEKINSLNQQLQQEKLKHIAPLENNTDDSSLTYLH